MAGSRADFILVLVDLRRLPYIGVLRYVNVKVDLRLTIHCSVAPQRPS